MKINWKIRFQNRTWLLTFCAAVLALIYQILSICGVMPEIGEEVTMGILSAVIDLLVMLGVVVDPTTPGTNDSDRALHYKKPGGESDEL